MTYVLRDTHPGTDWFPRVTAGVGITVREGRDVSVYKHPNKRPVLRPSLPVVMHTVAPAGCNAPAATAFDPSGVNAMSLAMS